MFKKLLLALLLVVTVSTTALAENSIRIDQTDPSLGDYVTFTTQVENKIQKSKNVRIEVLCYQDGNLVFGMGGSSVDAFLLGGGGSTWLANGGPAECVANLFYFGQSKGKQVYVRLASTEFHANG